MASNFALHRKGKSIRRAWNPEIIDVSLVTRQHA